MNTKIYMWIEPLVINHKKSDKKLYFNVIIEGNHTALEKSELENFILGKQMYDIMDFANIESNWNYGVVSATATNKKPMIEFADYPEDIATAIAEKKEEKRIHRIVHSKKPITLTKQNVEIMDGGNLKLKLPSLNVAQEIDFPKIWAGLEKSIIGKIKEGDMLKLTDYDGNVLLEVQGGSFLNIGLADLSVYDKKKMAEIKSIVNHMQGLKGGLFVREDGRIDVGDAKRTFWLQIYTNNLLKSSLRLNKSITELITERIIKSLPEAK